MELRFCCSEHKTDPLRSPCKLYDHIIVSPELRYCGPTQSGQYSKVSCQVDTTYLCIVWIQSELELRFCCTEIAGFASFILIPKSHFCQNGVKILWHWALEILFNYLALFGLEVRYHGYNSYIHFWRQQTIEKSILKILVWERSK